MDKYEALKTMSLEALNELNNQAVMELRRRHTMRAITAGANFRPGERAKFQSSKRGMVTILIDRINTKTVTGREVRADGSIGGGWKVGTTLLQRC